MNALLIYPMFAMFLLTLVTLVVMFTRRVRAVRSGKLKLSYFKTLQGDVPDDVLTSSRHFTNLFEAPVLYYVVCTLGMILSEGLLFLVLAWLYVIARASHAWIHMGMNDVVWRMRPYAVGWLILLLMWLVLIVHQLFPAPMG